MIISKTLFKHDRDIKNQNGGFVDKMKINDAVL